MRKNTKIEDFYDKAMGHARRLEREKPFEGWSPEAVQAFKEQCEGKWEKTKNLADEFLRSLEKKEWTHDSLLKTLALVMARASIYKDQRDRFSKDLILASLGSTMATHYGDLSVLAELTDSNNSIAKRILITLKDQKKENSKNLASTGGNARAAKIALCEKETIRLYQAGGSWKSAPEAAQEITQKIVEFSKKEGINLAPTTMKPLEWIRKHNKLRKIK